MLVAEDRLSDEQIAERLRMSRAGLLKWKRRPEFQARVMQLREQLRVAVVNRGITERQNRVDALNERWRLMRQVIEARAVDETMTAPGAKTGLMVRSYKQVGRDDFREEYTVDIALLKEMREHEKQAAQELGQWAEKVVTDGTVKIEYVNDWRKDDTPSTGR